MWVYTNLFKEKWYWKPSENWSKNTSNISEVKNIRFAKNRLMVFRYFECFISFKFKIIKIPIKGKIIIKAKILTKNMLNGD